MEFGSTNRPRNLIAMNGNKIERVGLNSSFNSNSNTLLVIKLPNPGVLRVTSRSLLLAMVILALPSIGSILKRPVISLNSSEFIDDSDPIGFDFFPSVLRDLSEQGIVKEGDKALVISPEIDDLVHFSAFFEESEVYFTVESDFIGHDSYPDGTFDLVLLFETTTTTTDNFPDRVLKKGGVLITQLSDDPSNAFKQPPNYKIVYLRRFESTIVGMRKMGVAVSQARKRRICGPISAAKKMGLEGVEDAVLEPGKLNREKMKFLPELLGESMESYGNRVLVTVDDKDGDFLKWFNGNYPKGDQDFEVHGLEIEKGGMLGLGFMKNLKGDEFVVMKAEARVVEEMMMMEKMICLIDELFLECGGGRKNGEERRRVFPYWECLALYGRVRDEGIAVHQWWT